MGQSLPQQWPETFGGESSTAIIVGHVKHVFLLRRLGHVGMASQMHLVMHLVLVLVELGELVRVHRRVPVRGVREVVELQHLCSGRGAPQY